MFTVPDIQQSLFGDNYFGENEVEWAGNAEISRLQALAVGKAYYTRLYSYSRFIKGDTLIALDSLPPGGSSFLHPQYRTAGDCYSIYPHGLQKYCSWESPPSLHPRNHPQHSWQVKIKVRGWWWRLVCAVCIILKCHEASGTSLRWWWHNASGFNNNNTGDLYNASTALGTMRFTDYIQK
jgi:hypothetical protein